MTPKMPPKIFKNHQKNDPKKERKKQPSTKHDKPVLVSEREARENLKLLNHLGEADRVWESFQRVWGESGTQLKNQKSSSQ